MGDKETGLIGEEEMKKMSYLKAVVGMKMILFGAGRRICLGIGLTMLYLEYYVANMMNEFEWKEVEGDE
ncbi:hypothetical protein EUTSA_v10019548mg, partial [Eutrema salsugineum]